MQRVDFLVDIEEKHLLKDQLIWIVALNGGVIVSSRLIREFRAYYGFDINRLVRDATRNQRLVEVEALNDDSDTF